MYLRAFCKCYFLVISLPHRARSGGGGGEAVPTKFFALHVPNVPQSITEEEFRSVFERFGEIDTCRLVQKHGKLFGNVRFKNSEHAEQARTTLDGTYLFDPSVSSRIVFDKFSEDRFASSSSSSNTASRRTFSQAQPDDQHAESSSKRRRPSAVDPPPSAASVVDADANAESPASQVEPADQAGSADDQHSEPVDIANSDAEGESAHIHHGTGEDRREDRSEDIAQDAHDAPATQEGASQDETDPSKDPVNVTVDSPQPVASPSEPADSPAAQTALSMMDRDQLQVLPSADAVSMEVDEKSERVAVSTSHNSPVDQQATNEEDMAGQQDTTESTTPAANTVTAHTDTAAADPSAAAQDASSSSKQPPASTSSQARSSNPHTLHLRNFDPSLASV
jgi:RNA recognition motif-containing protein